ncbi:MAG TPA: alanine racemase, partial [Chromatiales bacterium]|nr:alanine racemase [Chromatiales bacterium]HEX23017.1 alanine racemase [Chromatiales bacterium]
THLANADDRGDDTTRQQLECLAAVRPDSSIAVSIANSAGILAWPASHGDAVRPGIMLYGVSPMLNETGLQRGLRPVMTLQSELISIRPCKKGDAVGYGGSWVCPEDMPVGVVAMGYGDGYPRHAPSGTPVLLNGRRAALVGRVSMDMICVDLRGQPNAAVGDSVILWGDGLPAEEIAEYATTIAYALFCGVTSRVKKETIDG